ncbi:3-dehydrosphinganine reductase [Pichia californica]|uniref:3-ketodihydrosphingosine reductase TSC10 n=1 Tax=Pichia californica TaxID=460514 RepID=A0A9P7BED6_9ASCO|nr:3-dehydrosphinganine reductase [[Candida] californica]KAG0686554.1 3-dehydrosphinganine reductase [[Candida] californica]
MTNFEVDNKLVIISGASQGLGYSLSNKLHDLGANLIILARSEDKLKKLSNLHENNKKFNDQFTIPYKIDLSNYIEIENFKKFLIKNNLNNKIDIIFCCAGSSIPKLFTDLSINELDNGININYKTCLYLLHSLIPLMIENSNNNKKHIIILSSSVSFYSFIGYSQYAPLKNALKSLSDSLRHELKPFNIKVSTVFPGNFSSEGYFEENLTKPLITSEIEGSSKPITVDKCCDIIINSLSNGTTYIHTDLIGWILNSFSLGFGPRNWWGLQIIFSLIGSIFARLIDLYHEYLIKNWYIENNKVKKTK